MPTDIKPLLRPAALRPALAGFPFPDASDFLIDVFLTLLVYTPRASGFHI